MGIVCFVSEVFAQILEFKPLFKPNGYGKYWEMMLGSNGTNPVASPAFVTFP